MNPNFKKWDFVFHLHDKVNGLIVSDITDQGSGYFTAMFLWEDGIYGQLSWRPEDLLPGEYDPTILNIGNAFDLETAFTKNKKNNGIYILDNLTFIEILNGYREHLNEQNNSGIQKSDN